MFISPDVYARTVIYIDLDDKVFFEQSVNIAKTYMAQTQEIDKLSSPVCYLSKLSAQKDSENIAADRKLMYDKKRARRRFIMIDADFDEDDTARSEKLRQKLINFADTHETPLLIYPTKSYPEKPRFRAVLFAKTLMNSKRYEQAVRWLYQQLDEELLDNSDVRITANRNLPVFNSEEQIAAIYSTLDREELKPLNNNLWKDVPVFEKHAQDSAPDEDYENITFDTLTLMKAADELGKAKIAQSYETFWKIAQSVALAVIDGLITEKVALQIMERLATASGSEKAQEWSVGNVKLYHKYYSSLAESVEERVRARHLASYTEFAKAIRVL